MPDTPGYPEDALPVDLKSEIARAEHRANRAEREIKSDFNIVHSQAVVALWSALEDVVRMFLARWLLNLPQVKSEPAWADLNVKIGDYEQLEDEEKAQAQNTAAPLK